MVAGLLWLVPLMGEMPMPYSVPGSKAVGRREGEREREEGERERERKRKREER